MADKEMQIAPQEPGIDIACVAGRRCAMVEGVEFAPWPLHKNATLPEPGIWTACCGIECLYSSSSRC